MLSEERQRMIVSLVAQRRSMSLQELMEEIGTSESTIRRDLAELDDRGLLHKVYGGAVANESVFSMTDESMKVRQEQNHPDKAAIAKYAASLIKDSDFVYLDAGSTTELMIDYITARNVCFVTNGFSHAKKLSEAGFKTTILGGEIKLPTEAVVGEEAILNLQKYHFTKGFWGTNAINMEGFSTPDVGEALIKKVSMAHCQECFVLADKTKFSKISCVNFGALDDASIITSGILNNPEVSALKAKTNIIEVSL